MYENTKLFYVPVLLKEIGGVLVYKRRIISLRALSPVQFPPIASFWYFRVLIEVIQGHSTCTAFDVDEMNTGGTE